MTSQETLELMSEEELRDLHVRLQHSVRELERLRDRVAAELLTRKESR